MDKRTTTNMPDSNPGMIAAANASKDAQIAQSNNNLMGMQTMAAVQQLGILENSKNAQFQTLAWLTERLDGHDVKLEIAKENAHLMGQEATYQHKENMEGLKNEARELDIRAAEANKPQSAETTDFLT